MKAVHENYFQRFDNSKRERIVLASCNLITGLRYSNRKDVCNRGKRVHKEIHGQRYYVFYYFTPIIEKVRIC